MVLLINLTFLWCYKKVILNFDTARIFFQTMTVDFERPWKYFIKINYLR